MSHEPEGTLVVVTMRARHLPNRRRIEKQNPFCVLRVLNIIDQTEVVDRGGQTPQWNHESRFTVFSGQPRILKISILDETRVNPELISSSEIDFTEAINSTVEEGYDNWHQLQSNGRDGGEIYLEMTFYPSKPIFPLFLTPKHTLNVSNSSSRILGRRPLPPLPTSNNIGNKSTDSTRLNHSSSSANGHERTNIIQPIPPSIIAKSISNKFGRGRLQFDESRYSSSSNSSSRSVFSDFSSASSCSMHQQSVMEVLDDMNEEIHAKQLPSIPMFEYTSRSRYESVLNSNEHSDQFRNGFWNKHVGLQDYSIYQSRNYNNNNPTDSISPYTCEENPFYFNIHHSNKVPRNVDTNQYNSRTRNYSSSPSTKSEKKSVSVYDELDLISSGIARLDIPYSDSRSRSRSRSRNELRF